jgi:N-carbamoyl-L-amino-acid hydrolase
MRGRHIMDPIDRLREDLIEAGTFGRIPPKRVERYDQLDPQKGITRPTGTEANKKLRDYAVERMKEAGLAVTVDNIGNIFGKKEGFKNTKGTVMFGSHADSVTNGGMFDGSLGVFGAIEAMRRINEEGFENERPLEVVIFTGEEGSAFKQTLLGSSVLTGKTKLQQALGMKNDEGITLEESLKNIGYHGASLRGLDDIEYMVELHVEQGPILSKENMPIGIVENITGMAWLMVTIVGQENHAGTTPMKMRRDALVASSDLISFVNKRANEMIQTLGSSTVGTVGKLNVFPNGTNIVPGKVEMGIDIRDVRKEYMETLIHETLEVIKGLEEKYGVATSVQMPTMHDPVPLSYEVVDIVEKSANELRIIAKRVNSGAAHDSQNMAKKVKAGMIFVPSVNGISHAPMEWTNWEDVEKGVRVLTQTVKHLSHR